MSSDKTEIKISDGDWARFGVMLGAGWYKIDQVIALLQKMLHELEEINKTLNRK